jgi:hypothetical protein
VTRILDQQFIAHIFAPAEGTHADAAYQAINEIWNGCGSLFQMTDPIPGINLPHLLPGTRSAFPANSEAAIAARERPGADCQAILRAHHNVLNLSVALAPPQTAIADSASEADDTQLWWQEFDHHWNLLTARNDRHLLGEARLYLARIDANAGIRAASAQLYTDLSQLLPAGVPQPPRQSAGVSTSDGIALWETDTEPDDRSLRRLVLRSPLAPILPRAAGVGRAATPLFRRWPGICCMPPPSGTSYASGDETLRPVSWLHHWLP